MDMPSIPVRADSDIKHRTMPAQTAEALAEARAKAGTTEPRFNTADEMFEALDIDDSN